jgi:small subunit ribosomal protein S16
MLVIRMQRTGRKGHAQFRVVVQDARRTPTSGRVVAALGHFNPHTKEGAVDKEKATYYLEHGAQPSERVARLLKAEGVKLPSWVKLASGKKDSATRHPEKLRKNQPAEEKPAEAPAESPAKEPAAAEEKAPEAEAAPEAEQEKPAEKKES